VELRVKFLFILNDAPYGTERSYNGLRLAGALGKSPDNIELMVCRVIRSKGQVGLCGSCMDARALAAAEIVEGTHRSSMEELAQWTQWADKVIVF
jgi:uncharacterized protein involved in oxidation of intracellular sulfur